MKFRIQIDIGQIASLSSGKQYFGTEFIGFSMMHFFSSFGKNMEQNSPDAHHQIITTS